MTTATVTQTGKGIKVREGWTLIDQINYDLYGTEPETRPTPRPPAARLERNDHGQWELYAPQLAAGDELIIFDEVHRVRQCPQGLTLYFVRLVNQEQHPF